MDNVVKFYGTNHGFMPIMVKVDHPLDYIEALRTLNRNR